MKKGEISADWRIKLNVQNLSTKEKEKSANSWFLKKKAHAGRKSDFAKKAPERKKKIGGLNAVNQNLLTIKKKTRGFQKKPLIIIVNKKVSKRAVDRNLLKRRVKAIMRRFLESGGDYTIIIKPEALSLSFTELKEEITTKIK